MPNENIFYNFFSKLITYEYNYVKRFWTIFSVYGLCRLNLEIINLISEVLKDYENLMKSFIKFRCLVRNDHYIVVIMVRSNTNIPWRICYCSEGY